MLIIENLSDIYRLFINGMSIGGLLSGFPFIIGYAVNAVIKIANSQT